MKLIAVATSPYARKIRVMLAEKGLPFEWVESSPWEPDGAVAELNPLGKVPVLITDDGEVFFDSPVIAGWIETLPATPRLLPANPQDAVRVRQTEALADGIADAALAIVLEGRRPEGQRSEEEIGRQLQKIERGLDQLEQQIAGRPWLQGKTISLGDIAAGATFAYLDLRLPHLGWRFTRPELALLAERLLQRPSFQESTPRMN